MSPHRPPSTPLARSRISTTSQETIDTLLKSLKAHTRTLNAIFAQHTAEMAVLERLYYKGKNQHGASLLWQRVSEMRRYGKRLQAMDICGLPEALRATFYGEPTATTTKKLKGAWTHYPSASYFKWALRLLLLGKQLLEKVHVNLLIAVQRGH
ncbi:hypothetical protein OF83DRAFT_224480 [Amylostereum chailletii]|nr:hypothetical protein OF83DRAFT_224480 [Amylostereum chailletii]